MQMTELSTATQAVLDAFRSSHTGPSFLAAVLRATADQVVPDQGAWIRECRGDAWTRWKERKLIRREILAIANKLEAHKSDHPGGLPANSSPRHS